MPRRGRGGLYRRCFALRLVRVKHPSENAGGSIAIWLGSPKRGRWLLSRTGTCRPRFLPSRTVSTVPNAAQEEPRVLGLRRAPAQGTTSASPRQGCVVDLHNDRHGSGLLKFASADATVETKIQRGGRQLRAAVPPLTIGHSSSNSGEPVSFVIRTTNARAGSTALAFSVLILLAKAGATHVWEAGPIALV
jgi:hypothetical protein